MKLSVHFFERATFVWQQLEYRFLVINVCNHGEHYETPCICLMRGATSHSGVS